MPQAGEPSPEQRAGASRLARQGESDRFDDAEHERDGQDPHQPEAGVGLEEEPEPALGLRANVDFVTAPAARAPGFGDGRAPMTNASVRRDDHARARDARSPAEVDVVRPWRRCRIEAGQLVEQVGAHEHRRVRDEEHVAYSVVLLLIDLVGLDARERDAIVVDRHADLEEDLRMVVIDDLRTDDAGVRAIRLFDHDPDRVRVEHDVVVAEQEERRAFDRAQRLVGGGREPSIGAQPADVGIRHRGRDPGGRVVRRAVVEDEDRERRVVLERERVDGLFEPRPTLVGDDDGDDGRSDLAEVGLGTVAGSLHRVQDTGARRTRARVGYLRGVHGADRG